MSDFLKKAATELNQKITAGAFDGRAKFNVQGEGTIIIDQNGARVADEDADVTLSADADTFRSIFEGDLNPTSAFMSGKLSVEGDMGMAMKLAATLA
ncbi:SCP2 sterol-binding domain-containing protein [Pontibaca salina]|uniref:SCP2 sterol-binding domain-containing protein n=1 Tax=Pontibaca salina TaxID=2795731 RepID=A0A934M1P3_9RHOB|nr:SCP2 sterol-binding domain-containing protein [Pontibaca salina]MBI6629846.1 SCP2 sterol-binding domain-containing protein [Pontibaca salina]